MSIQSFFEDPLTAGGPPDTPLRTYDQSASSPLSLTRPIVYLIGEEDNILGFYSVYHRPGRRCAHSMFIFGVRKIPATHPRK